MHKVIKKAFELKKLGKIQGLTQTKEWSELMSCFPLQFEAGALLKDFPKAIAVRNLYSHDDLRLSVYCLPKGAVMPIHDHPSMFVLTYLLLGDMLMSSYTRVGKDAYKK